MTVRQHGTHARYVRGPSVDDVPGKGCRCDPCRTANRDYERARAARIEPAYVAATPARQHVAWLSTQGVGLKQIARQSGISHGALWKLMYGHNGRPSKRIRRTTLDRLLAVMPSHGADGSRVPAGPVWDDVEALLARGWTKVAIGRAIGQTGPGLQLGDQSVTRRNANAVRALLDQPVPPRRDRYGNLIPPPEPPSTGPPPTTPRDDVIVRLAEILEVRVDHADWRRDAACRGRPTWLWFPAVGDTETLERALRICRSCLVREQCANAHIDEPAGVFGGMSARERRQRRSRAAS